MDTCHALNVSDEKRCLETATSINGLFCSFHSRQCQGLYRGYKIRTARLERLDEKLPPYLANTKTPLVNQTFENVTTEAECRELHDWLWTKYQLLERVIKARRLHHSRFFSMNMDYGHEKFLDQLVNQKGFVTKALERLQRRTAEILYENQQWFKWVRECQDEEEENREKEQKKIKQEAQLWQRNWKQVSQRIEAKRLKEEKRKQKAFLEKLYKENLNNTEESEDDEMDWDPIDDVMEDSRGTFIDLIRHFLWMASPEEVVAGTVTGSEEQDVPENEAAAPQTDNGTMAIPEATNAQAETPASSKKSKKKKKKATEASTAATSSQNHAPQPLPDKALIESKESMHERLAHGTEINRGHVSGLMVGGTIENPHVETKTRSFPEDEIQRLLGEITEIKHLLFCRLVLGHPTLLPIALRANSVEEFFADAEVTGAALRDICLKMEKPGLQEIRDACADFFRSDQEEDENSPDNDAKDLKVEAGKPKDPYDLNFKAKKKRGELPEKWISKRERARETERQSFGDMVPSPEEILGGPEGTAIDFGDIKTVTTTRKKIRVKICGRTIWNYPSDKAMSRGGWLHFCLIAKDSSLKEAVSLCRNWDEFFELNILACWDYFPAAKWLSWIGNRFKQQALQLGFIMYFDTFSPDARDLSTSRTTGGRGQFRRSHAILEARNFICAHIKRDDPVSRRLIQYLAMQTHRLLLLVRDTETGRLLVKPPEEERWLFREKSGIGRASRNEWNVLKEIGPQFFEEMETHREWRFSFKEYYDVYVWDLEPGERFAGIFNVVQEMLVKALRCTTGVDMYKLAAPVLKTLRRDENGRTCDMRPGDPESESMWGVLTDPRSKFIFGEVTENGFAEGVEPNTYPRHLLYNEADALEDDILFPEERALEKVNPLNVGFVEPLRVWEQEGFSIKKFIEASWDWEDSDYESEQMSISDDEESDCSHMLEDTEHSHGQPVTEDNTSLMSASETGSDGSFESYPTEVQDLLVKLSIKDSRRPEKRGTAALDEEFRAYLENETSRVFKKVWHKADTAPNAQERYSEMIAMAKYSRRHNQSSLHTSSTILSLKLSDELDVTPSDSKDLHKALGKVYPFFNPEFLETDKGKQFKDSLLFKQEERARTFPDIRTHISTKHRPEEFYAEFDKKFQETKHDDDLDALPFEWDMNIRPIIAHLYKSGVIRSHASTVFNGQAFSTTEPVRPDKQDMFIDWRILTGTIIMPPDAQKDPSTIPPLLTTAREFRNSHPNAKFAVLRLWSAPYFYPLTIGYDKRENMSFRDLTGRIYVWLFVPKDMPNSEYSIHISASRRIMPFKRQFGDKVVAKRDKFLVMGEDEADLLRLVTGVTYAIQMRPWRLEVDLWMSFINVDLGFLENLNERWWDWIR
ncbi:mfs allantoate protein [Rutstroemia sp. NJR-2017a BVV2]|nr:mfs allantoate protein [Rutstroemia sp. NJR-2017a BVV2]